MRVWSRKVFIQERSRVPHFLNMIAHGVNSMGLHANMVAEVLDANTAKDLELLCVYIAVFNLIGRTPEGVSFANIERYDLGVCELKFMVLLISDSIWLSLFHILLSLLHFLELIFFHDGALPFFAVHFSRIYVLRGAAKIKNAKDHSRTVVRGLTLNIRVFTRVVLSCNPEKALFLFPLLSYPHHSVV